MLRLPFPPRINQVLNLPLSAQIHQTKHINPAMTVIAIVDKSVGRPNNGQRTINLNGLKNDLLINNSGLLPRNGRSKSAYLLCPHYRLTGFISCDGLHGAVRTKHSSHGCRIGIAHAIENSDTN